MSDPVQPSTVDLPPDPLLKSEVSTNANGRSQSAESSKLPNGSISGGTLPDLPAESKVKRRGMASETWLPAGWLTEDRVRNSGARPGLVDKYYLDPSSGRKFRSKKEVLCYLETGTPQPKRKKGTETPGNEEVVTGVSPGKKQRKSNTKPKPSKFDFVNVPEKVDWLLINASTDSWTPFLGDDQVPEFTKQDWAATFTSLSANQTDQAMA